ncbi:extracellular solute-binding protein family 1 [Rhodopirellula maiorica SM1]|uniref:Extracellular solute-binding protein family 1 n=1 Tax=Rhodopirellula maiorica SM1 TaxID=1265738 RepID=M5RWG5_9BACT|nr:ABC transporter substrate-binding protein [Rhodopirellula maiorica]EMI18279.1 extracellular solute-binding protein family 1 [Rhodopirellula maiorica SM1]
MAESPHAIKLNRRQLLATATGAALTLPGCTSRPEAEPQSTASRSDVPIRVAMVGTSEEADIVSRSWSSIDEQPLEITPVSLPRANADRQALDRLIAETGKSDLVIYPLLAVPELVHAEAIVPISEEQFDAMQAETGELYSAVRNGAARYADEFIGMPMGANQPALLSTAEVPPLSSWQDYDRWVSKDLSGKANEPLVTGWAASMFLWRAASMISQGWLFSRNDFQPTLNEEAYVDTLQQMIKTAAHYPAQRQSPTEIWDSIQSGELLGGIGFAANNAAGETEVSVSNLPGTDDKNRLLLDPYSLVISLSAMCRQSAVSKRIMDWISGGDGSEAIRRQISGVTTTRSMVQSEIAVEPRRQSAYESWLTQRLRTPVTLPPLQLFDAGEYYSVLDSAIREAIDGKMEAKSALDRVAKQWDTITERVGREKQLSAWRRAQGLRA